MNPLAVASTPASPAAGPGSGLGLAALATAAFVYVTAEILPIGLLPQMSGGLHVSESSVGLLVTVYAAVAGLTAIPMTALTQRRPRRQVVVAAVALLALSQLTIAIAPGYGVVVGARVLCACAHGVFWSVLAPIAARLVGPERAGRATAIVFSGNSLAVVLGAPLGTALGNLLGWRAAAALVGAAAVISVIAIRAAVPVLGDLGRHDGAQARQATIAAALGNVSVLAVCVVTLLVVIGHFTAYTYIAPLVQRDAGITGVALSAVLLAYGVAGVVGIGLAGWITDRRPRLSSAACAISVALALTALSTVGQGSVVVTVAATMVWGAGFTAIPVGLQSAVLRVAPHAADTASALYVVAFQIGIGGGALAGSILVDAGHLAALPLAGAGLAAGGTAVLLAARKAFPPTANEPPQSGSRVRASVSESQRAYRALDHPD